MYYPQDNTTVIIDRNRSNSHVDIVEDIEVAIERAQTWRRVKNWVIFLHTGIICIYLCAGNVFLDDILFFRGDSMGFYMCKVGIRRPIGTSD